MTSQPTVPIAALIPQRFLASADSFAVPPSQTPTTNAMATKAIIVTKVIVEPIEGITISGILGKSGMFYSR